MNGQSPVTAVAVSGQVRIEFPVPADHWTLTPEQADAFWNQVAEAELVALEQRVRARRRVTAGARGGWADAAPIGRHAADAAYAATLGMCPAEKDNYVCTLPPGHIGPHEAHGVHGGLCATWPLDAAGALARSAAAAEDRIRAAAPDYQHPDDDDE